MNRKFQSDISITVIYFHMFVAGNDRLLKVVSQSLRLTTSETFPIAFPVRAIKKAVVRMVINGFYN